MIRQERETQAQERVLGGALISLPKERAKSARRAWFSWESSTFLRTYCHPSIYTFLVLLGTCPCAQATKPCQYLEGSASRSVYAGCELTGIWSTCG